MYWISYHSDNIVPLIQRVGLGGGGGGGGGGSVHDRADVETSVILRVRQLYICDI